MNAFDLYLLLKTKGSTLPDSFMAAHPATVWVWFGVTSMALCSASVRECVCVCVLGTGTQRVRARETQRD